MWDIGIFSLFSILTVFYSTQADKSDDGLVAVLDGATFDEFVEGNPLSLIEFYAPWCGHCKKLAPEYDNAALQLKDSDIPLAKVDCTTDDNKELCGKYEIKGFPTLKIFRGKEEPSPYEAGRTAKDIVKYMKKQNSPAWVVIKISQDLETLKLAGDLIVLYNGPLEGQNYDTFIGLANTQRDTYDFGISTNLAAALPGDSGITVPEGTSIILLKPFDEGHNVYQGSMEEAAVISFLERESLPLLGELNADTYAQYTSRGVPIFYFFVDPKGPEQDAIKIDGKVVAADFKGKLSFVTLDGVKWERFMSGTFGVKSPPGGAIQDGKKVYTYTGDILKREEVHQFASDYINGKIEPFVKSQQPPADNSGPVTVVVGKEFDKIVLDETKDVFMEFYAPWCGHCKKLTPAYEKVGENFADDDNVVIAKSDSTENDSPIDVSGFPTLMFFSSEDKEGKTYNGDRTAEAIIKYINDNRVTEKASGKKHEEL